MSVTVLCLTYRNCYSCIFGYCEACDGNGADEEEREIHDMARGFVMILGCLDPGPLVVACKCADSGHPWREVREDEPSGPLAVSPLSAIVISSDLL